MRVVAAVAFVLLAFGVTSGAAAEDRSVRYLLDRERGGGGFAEANGSPGLSLTAWVVLGLRARGATPSSTTIQYLLRTDPRDTTELALALMSRSVLGLEAVALRERLRAAQRPSGLIGPTLNSTIWAVLALRQARAPVPPATRRLLLARQARSGGWAWATGIAADTNDTAAAVQALRSVGVRGRPITRALAYLRRHQNRDGGFELTSGRGSDTQSTAWAIQAFVAAGAHVPPGAIRYLTRMRRADGSFRYSARYAATPVWVTAQALPALGRKPFPLR